MHRHRGLVVCGRFYLNHHKLPRQQIEDTAKQECHQRTAEDNYVIGHAEIRGGQVDEKDGRVDSAETSGG